MPADVLLTRLEDLAAALDDLTGADPGFAARVVSRIEVAPARGRDRGRGRRGLLVLAAAVVLAVLAVPAPRRAVARWFGIGAVQITRTDVLPAGTDSRLQLGQHVAVDEAVRDAGFEVLLPPAPGRPAAFRGRTAAGELHFVWAPSTDLPEVGDSGVGLLLSEVPGAVDRPLLEKVLAPATTLTPVDVAGVPGYWIEGPVHEIFYLDAAGRPVPGTARLAANTLVWARDGVTFRLESALDRDGAVELAETMRPA